MNEVFDRYRDPKLAKVSDPESWAMALTGRFWRPFYWRSDLRDGGRPAIAAEGVSHPAAPGQGTGATSDRGSVSPCTTVTAEETPKEQAGLVSLDEWGV